MPCSEITLFAVFVQVRATLIPLKIAPTQHTYAEPRDRAHGGPTSRQTVHYTSGYRGHLGVFLYGAIVVWVLSLLLSHLHTIACAVSHSLKLLTV